MTITIRKTKAQLVRKTTKCKKVEELIFKNMLFSAQQEASLDGSLIINEQDKILFYNQRLVQMWGITLEEVKLGSGKLVFQSLQDKLINPEEFIKRVKYLYENKHESNRIEITLKDGRIFGQYSIPLFGPSGKYYGRSWFFRDITEIQIIRNEAQKANQAKRTFLMNLSHEIRTPLNAVLGFSQLMLRNPALTSEQHQQLQSILQSGEHLLTLINDLLEMSKIEAGDTSVVPAVVDLYTLLQYMEAMLVRPAESKGLQLTFQIADKLPRYVVTDENKLKQILINLLNNAVKFTDKGRITFRMWVERDESESLRLMAEVEDTGIGIPAEDLDKIFEVFEQIAANAQIEGLGMGLALSQNLAHMLGGEISVQSELGKGSSFRLKIPVGESENIGESENSEEQGYPVGDAVKGPSKEGYHREPEDLGPEALVALPTKLVESICEAAQTADYFWLLELVDQVDEQSPQVAQRLRELANNFQYDRLLELFEKSTGDKENM